MKPLPPSHSERGAALILTLLFLTLIAIIAVGFSDSARVERTASRSHFERLRATSIAQQGIERTIATLQRETIDPADPTATTPEAQAKTRRNWISQPGALIVANDPPYPSGVDNKQLRRLVELSSGEPLDVKPGDKSVDPILLPPNLNVQTLVEQNPPIHLITDRIDSTDGLTARMHLRWIYVRENGALYLKNPSDPRSAPIEKPNPATDPSLKTNPIVGRFAYWADDESSKINYNLAWKRDTKATTTANTNDSQEAHPSRINLMALTLKDGTNFAESLADRVNQFRKGTPGRYFNSFADARALAPQFPDAADRKRFEEMLEFNRFELTHYNNDPDTTFFGEDRILLTTNRKLVPPLLDKDGKQMYANGKPLYARKFLDILRDDVRDPLTGVAMDPDPGVLEHIAGGQPDYSRPGFPVVANKFDPVVRTVMNYITTKEWPLSPGVSFKEKYKYANEGELGQIAVNIIDYVRARESNPAAVQRQWPGLPAPAAIAPLRFAVGPDGKFTLHPSHTYGAANSYQGICRGPYITEMAVYVENKPVDRPLGYPPASPPPAGWPKTANGQNMLLYPAWFSSEIYLPANYGFVDKAGKPIGIDLVPDLSPKPKPGPPSEAARVSTDPGPGAGSFGWFASWTETRDPKQSKYYYYSKEGKGQMVLMETHNKVTKDTGDTNAVRVFKEDVAGGQGPNFTVLEPGRYVVVTKVFYRDDAWKDDRSLDIRGVLYRGTSGNDGLMLGTLNRWPRVNIGTQTGNIPYPISDPATTAMGGHISIETDDPRCNVHPKDWQLNLSKRNTLGAPNSRSSVWPTPKAPLNVQPQQDTDRNGKVSDYSLYMPPPRDPNSKDPKNGRLTSIAELGYIHTGNDAKVGSTPWRTIRLQPNNYKDSKTLPDWAFMDLFAVPSKDLTGKDSLGPQPIYTPHGTSVAGRVNVNSHVEPFPRMARDRGLVALLNGTRRLATPDDAKTVAQRIYDRKLASAGGNQGKIYGYPWKTSVGINDSNAFDTPGEICEIEGVADGGEESEDLVREIASLVTARGNVFGVYTIGQALKQTPDGKLIVNAEQRQHAIVERYLDTRGTPDPLDDETRIRTVYFRNLLP